MIEPVRDLVRRLNPDAPGLRGAEVLLLVVLHQDIDDSPQWQQDLFLISPRRREAFPGYAALMLLSQEWTLRHKEDVGGMLRRNYEKRREEALSAYGEELPDRLTSGRVKIVYLLNSGGGAGVVMSKMENAGQAVQERGGEVVAFATTHAQSAAGFVFLTAAKEKRFALPETALMLHAPHTGDPRKVALSRMGRQTIQEVTEKITDLLRRDVLPEKWAEVERLLEAVKADTGNPLNEVRICGMKAAEYGITASTPSGMEGLADIFTQETGLPAQNTPLGNPLSDFFYLSTLELVCMRDFGMRLQLALGEKKIDLGAVLNIKGFDPDPNEDRLFAAMERVNAIRASS